MHTAYIVQEVSANKLTGRRTSSVSWGSKAGRISCSHPTTLGSGCRNGHSAPIGILTINLGVNSGKSKLGSQKISNYKKNQPNKQNQPPQKPQTNQKRHNPGLSCSSNRPSVSHWREPGKRSESRTCPMMWRTPVNAWVLNPAADSKTETQLYCMRNFKLLNVLTYSDLNITAPREN